MLQTLIASESDSKTVTNATHVRGQVGSRALIVPTHTNHLSTTCLPHVRLETRLPVGTKFREGWSLGTRLAYLHVMAILLGLAYTFGLALFQANAIQFGLDQLLEAPTLKLIAFIHWYYWAQNVGSLAFFYAMGSGFLILDATDEKINGTISQFLNGNIDNTKLVCFTIAMSIALTAVLSKFCSTKKHFYIQKAGLNPFKNIYKVLKYSWKHKVPEHRSAFTYWEEDIPQRIDLGKNKYGGPFTNEEVEDAKTFLRILPLILCLFGYHLTGDGYSAPEHLQRASSVSFTTSTATDCD